MPGFLQELLHTNHVNQAGAQSRLSSPLALFLSVLGLSPRVLFLFLGLGHLSEQVSRVLGKGPHSEPTWPGCARGRATRESRGGDWLHCLACVPPPPPTRRRLHVCRVPHPLECVPCCFLTFRRMWGAQAPRVTEVTRTLGLDPYPGIAG